MSSYLFGAVSRYATFGPRSSTSVGLGVWLPFCWLRLFRLSTRLQIRLLLSTPLCLCRLWLAWLGVAPVVAAVAMIQ